MTSDRDEGRNGDRAAVKGLRGGRRDVALFEQGATPSRHDHGRGG